ncbi:MAG: hypothetical protein K2R98_29560 [Gemmataceae bacterium]|nr:hypothetical protein [Gemmataceae bacterium]
MCVTGKSIWQGATGAERNGFKGVYVLECDAAAPRAEWKRKMNGIPATCQPFFACMAANDADTIYLGGGQGYPKSGPSVLKTSDGGETWTNVFETDGNKNIATGWAGEGGDFRWSWPEYVLGLDVSPVDRNRVVITDLGCIHLTTDGGKTWRQIYNTPAGERTPGRPTPRGDVYVSRGMEPTAAWYVAWLDEKNLIGCYSDIRGVRSTDGGKHWGWNYSGHQLNALYHAIQHPSNGRAYAAASGLHDMYMSMFLADNTIDKAKGLAVYSTDAGANWKALHDFGSPVLWLAPDPKQPNRLYASVAHSKNGGIWRTDDLDKDGASTWTRLSAPPRTEGHPLNIHVLHDGTLACSFSGRRAGKGFTPSSGFFISDDAGKTWEDRSDPGMRYWTKDVVPDPHDRKQNIWYACVFHAWGPGTSDGKSGLYRTRDRGKTWALLAGKELAPSGLLNVNSLTIDPSNPNEAYLTTEYDGLWWTGNLRDAKPTFVPVTSYPFRHPTRVFFNPYQKSEVWVTSFGNGIHVGTVDK